MRRHPEPGCYRAPGGGALEAEATAQPLWGENDAFACQSFGAQFIEVGVARDIGRVRVSRMVSIFDVGRMMNARATLSQVLGGIAFGRRK